MNPPPSIPDAVDATRFTPPGSCPHDRLLARYRNRTAQLAGLAMGYKCQSCLTEFLPGHPVPKRFRETHPVEATTAAE